MLEGVVSGVLKSSFVLILDTAKQRGDKIACAISSRHKTQNTQIHGLCFEHSSLEQEKRLGVGWITLHDIFSDSINWSSNYDHRPNLHEFMISNVEQGSKVVLWIDSLSEVLVNISVENLYSQLQRLLKGSSDHGVEIVQLISTIHTDMEDESTVRLLSHLASTIIRVKPPQDSVRRLPIYELTHHKPSGKVFKEEMFFIVKDDGTLKSQPLSTEEKIISLSNNSTNKPVHDNFSTFRHGLSTEEQKSRDDLVLPYQKLALNPTRGQGRIEYEPEEADEWDEEDPDDDLEV